MPPVNVTLPLLLRSALLLTAAGAIGACSSTDGLLSGDKIDYKSQATKTAPLDIPPDLTQLQRDSRYQPQSGTISASTYGSAAAAAAIAAPTAAPTAAPGAAPTGAPATASTMAPNPATAASARPAGTVAPASIGEMHIARDGNQRWLSVPIPPEQLWPQLRAFWQERGLALVVDNPDTGVMETDWAENRAKLPLDAIRRTLGRALDTLYDTGERDRFRTRVERNASGSGSDVFITHRGMVEIYTNERKDFQSTMWTQRPSDPELEAEMLSRLMVKLGAKEEVARASVAAKPPTVAPRARALEGLPSATLQVDESFDRAWRRVGLTLDRSGFTVEDRDRAGGLYFVRYVDPKDAASAADPGFFAKMLSLGKSDTGQPPVRYRIVVKADGTDRTQVAVQDAQGAPENGEVGKRIVALLVEDLK
jgi:outer membrane protein assembly factor BamC